MNRVARVASNVAVALCALVSTAAQAQIPPQYLNALQRAQYQVFAGDYNSDGSKDVLLKAPKRIVLIDFDVPIPVAVNPVSPSFVLMSSGSSYTLTVNPSQTILNSPVWQPASHDLIFGDVLGTGNTAMLLRARTTGVPSFVIATSSANGQPVLMQQLSTATLGVDISGSTHTVTLTDTNHDGRADLVLRTNGLIDTVFAADSSGLFAAPDDDQDRVMMAWRAFCAALDSGDISSAQQFIVGFSRAKYVEALTALGTDVRNLTGTLSEPREISTTALFAEYVVTQTYAGSAQAHLIVFRKTGGSWLLEEF